MPHAHAHNQWCLMLTLVYLQSKLISLAVPSHYGHSDCNLQSGMYSAPSSRIVVIYKTGQSSSFMSHHLRPVRSVHAYAVTVTVRVTRGLIFHRSTRTPANAFWHVRGMLRALSFCTFVTTWCYSTMCACVCARFVFEWKRAHACIYVYECKCLCVCVCACVRACMLACMRVSECVHVSTCVRIKSYHTHTHTHTQINTHTHTHTHWWHMYMCIFMHMLKEPNKTY